MQSTNFCQSLIDLLWSPIGLAHSATSASFYLIALLLYFTYTFKSLSSVQFLHVSQVAQLAKCLPLTLEARVQFPPLASNIFSLDICKEISPICLSRNLSNSNVEKSKCISWMHASTLFISQSQLILLEVLKSALISTRIQVAQLVECWPWNSESWVQLPSGSWNIFLENLSQLSIFNSTFSNSNVEGNTACTIAKTPYFTNLY